MHELRLLVVKVPYWFKSAANGHTCCFCYKGDSLSVSLSVCDFHASTFRSNQCTNATASRTERKVKIYSKAVWNTTILHPHSAVYRMNIVHSFRFTASIEYTHDLQYITFVFHCILQIIPQLDQYSVQYAVNSTLTIILSSVFHWNQQIVHTMLINTKKKTPVTMLQGMTFFVCIFYKYLQSMYFFMKSGLGFFGFEYYQLRGPTHQMHCMCLVWKCTHGEFEVFKTHQIWPLH